MPPTILLKTLETVRWRVRLFSVLFGVGIVVCAIVGLLLSTILLDYFLNLPTPPRLVVMLAALVGVGYVVAHWVVHPMLARLGLSDIAGKLEHAFPAFDDRLRSTVDFVTKGTPGSDVMKDRVVAEATELSQRFKLESAVRAQPVLYSAGAAAGSVLFMVLLASLVGKDYLSPAFERLFAPFGTHPWPRRVEISMVGDLPQRVPVGQRVEVRMRLAKGDKPNREARVFYQYGDGRVEKEIMTRGPDGVYSSSLDARADATGGNGVMKVWMESGDDETTPTAITIVQRLAITHVDLVVTPPPYTGEPPVTTDLGAAPATVTYGSTLGLKVYFNKAIDPKQPVTVTPGVKQTKLPEIQWDIPLGSGAAGQWVARDSATFQIHATDTDGFSNPDMTDYQVIVRQDQPPTVQITNPVHNEECTPVAVIPLKGIAEDDYGIQSMKLIAVKLGDKPVQFPPIDLVKAGKPVDGVTLDRLESAGEMRRWQVGFGWDLSHLDSTPLKPGDVIEYYLQVTDNFSFEGQYHQPVNSGKLRITIFSQEQFTALMTDLAGQVRDQIIEIRNTQRSIKSQTGDLRHDTQKQPELNHADRTEATQLVAGQTTAAAQARQSAQKLDDILQRLDENKSTAQDLKDVAQSVKDDLNQVAEHPMKDAASQIDAAKNQKADPDPAKQQAQTDARNNTLDQAQANQQQATDKLDQAASRMGEVGGLPKAIQQLKDILEHQREISKNSNDVGLKNLGKTPEQMDPKDRAAQQKNADDQNALSDKTQKALEQMQAEAQKLSKTDPAASKAMQQAAQTGQQQNVPSQMKNSAQAQQQNQQAQAQQSQAQVEIGLQMMIRQLEEAQNRKLMELERQLADMNDQIKSLIREQSGLNYDNLSLQGGEVLKKMDAAVLDHLLEEAERTKDALPPTPDMGTQTRLQEQTEHNTRTVAKAAQALPDGATVEEQLSRAADRMGRAITFLRDDTGTDPQRLASAYDPPQSDALAALEKAQEIVAEQLKKNQDQQAEQKKEAIRAAYEKILADQKKLDADTLVIDKAPKNADGQLGHADTLRLGKLPDSQGALAARTSKLDDDLNAVGSIVYVWANKDIVDTMKNVKLDLAKPETGVATQAEQTRIEEQLQAMIDSLKIKPKEKKFEKPHEGSGSGKSGTPPPSLPSEAELRLLKALQQAINKSTTTLSGQPNPDKPKITALGGRQGQVRELLAQLLEKASKGQIKLGPEPDPKDKLPEEASSGDVETQELEHALLNDDGQPDGDQLKQDAGLIGQRMARSRQRLALDNDPGNVTQEIQKRIVQNMDALIEMARAEQASGKPSPSSGKPEDAKPADPSAGGQQPGNSAPGQKPGQPKPGQTPANASTDNHDVDTGGTPTTDITQTLKEWGAVSPRKRAAVIEAASEKPIEKFKNFIDDYYRALGSKATEGNN